MIYYDRFRIVLRHPIFRSYLKKEYERGVNDLAKLNHQVNFHKKNVTVLLCGVGNEGTAELFIDFVREKNPKAKIIIIDLGKEQIAAVTRLVKEKYSDLNIIIKQINALELQAMIKKESIDWIETDGFLEFFDNKSLQKMLSVWFAILKKDGFITTRMPVYANSFEKKVHEITKLIAKKWLNVTIYCYKTDAFNKLVAASGFVYVTHKTMIPTLDSYTMIKERL